MTECENCKIALGPEAPSQLLHTDVGAKIAQTLAPIRQSPSRYVHIKTSFRQKKE